MSTDTTQLEPALVSAKDAAKLCGVGDRMWRTMNRDGRIPEPVRLGRRVLWRVEELRDWARAGCPPRRRWEWPKKDLDFMADTK